MNDEFEKSGGGPGWRVVFGETTRIVDSAGTVARMSHTTRLGRRDVDVVASDACLMAAAHDGLNLANLVLANATVETPPVLVEAAEAFIAKVEGRSSP